MTIKERVSKP